MKKKIVIYLKIKKNEIVIKKITLSLYLTFFQYEKFNNLA